MKITGIATIDVEIDTLQQKEITEKFLMEVFDIPSEECFINDKGQLIFVWEQSAGTHSYIEEKVIRTATKSDKLYFKFMNKLEKLYNEE